ncbi:hypothetical protein D3C72_2044280 [compost metagenome]
MLFGLTKHAESARIIAAFTRHKCKQRVEDIVIPFLLGHQPQLAAHEFAVFLHQHFLIPIQRIIQSLDVNKW